MHVATVETNSRLLGRAEFTRADVLSSGNEQQTGGSTSSIKGLPTEAFVRTSF